MAQPVGEKHRAHVRRHQLVDIRARDDDKRRTPIILVTAEARIALGGQEVLGLFDATLTKPIKPETLFDAIAKVMMAKGAQAV